MGGSLQVLSIFSDVVHHRAVRTTRNNRLAKLSESNLTGLMWTVNQTVVLLVHVVSWAEDLVL